jgi:PAS domain S-box-containing protein
MGANEPADRGPPAGEEPQRDDLLRSLVDGIGDYAIFLLDPAGHVLTWNPGAERIKGYSAGEIIGKHFSKFYSTEEVRAGKPQRMLETANAEGSCEDEGWRIRKDGSRFFANVLVTCLHNSDGSVRGYAKIVRDITDRRRQEEAVHRSEERFRLLVEGVRDYGIYLLDREGRIVSWNSGAERMKGYVVDEVLGKHFSIFYPKEEVEAGKPMLVLEIAAAEGRFEEEGWRVRKDGTRFWASVLITALRGEHGKLRGFSKVVRDITERKRAREELLESDAKARAVLETAVNGIITIDEQGVIESFNPAAERIFGYDADEMIGQKVNMLMPLPDSERHDDYLANYLRTGERKIIGIGREVTGRRRDGSTFPLELAISEVRLGTRRLFTGIVNDISARKRAEDELRASETKARAVLETAVDGILTIDRRGLIESFNPAAERIFGYGAAEVIGKKINMLMPPPDSERHDDYLANYLRTGERKIIGIGREVTGKRKDGSTFPMDLSISEVQHNGEVTFTGIVRDISERKEAQARLAALVEESQRTARELAASNASKDELLALISHELRTPVTTILGSANLIRRRPEGLPMEASAELVEAIEEESRRLMLLIESLLSIARSDLGRSEAREVTHLDQLVASVIDRFRARNSKREVNWYAGELPPLEAIRTYIEQVIENLVENADKYSPPGLPIEVRADTSEDGRAVEVRVLDRGTGIAEEEADLIFQSFYRSPSNATVATGKGLGLTVCKRLVEIHGGDIWATPREGGGLEVGFRIPVNSHVVLPSFTEA